MQAPYRCCVAARVERKSDEGRGRRPTSVLPVALAPVSPFRPVCPPPFWPDRRRPQAFPAQLVPHAGTYFPSFPFDLIGLPVHWRTSIRGSPGPL